MECDAAGNIIKIHSHCCWTCAKGVDLDASVLASDGAGKLARIATEVSKPCSVRQASLAAGLHSIIDVRQPKSDVNRLRSCLGSIGGDTDRGGGAMRKAAIPFMFLVPDRLESL